MEHTFETGGNVGGEADEEGTDAEAEECGGEEQPP